MPITHPHSGPVERRLSLHRPMVVGAALVLWAAILIGLRLLTV